MGRTRTPTYRVEWASVLSNGRRTSLTQSAWDYGVPSDEKLASYVESLMASTRPGGINEQLGQLNIGRAQIVRQADGKVVAEYVAPLFQVIA